MKSAGEISSVEEFLTEWHRVVAAKDLEGLWPLLAEDVSLGAPPYWQHLEGREVVHHLLGIVVNTIEDFTYRREWVEGSELALEFTGHIGELGLQAIDLISLDERFAVRKLDVLMRPAKTIGALREAVAPRMMEFFASRGSAS